LKLLIKQSLSQHILTDNVNSSLVSESEVSTLLISNPLLGSILSQFNHFHIAHIMQKILSNSEPCFLNSQFKIIQQYAHTLTYLNFMFDSNKREWDRILVSFHVTKGKVTPRHLKTKHNAEYYWCCTTSLCNSGFKITLN